MLRVLHGGTEHNCALIPNILQPGIDDQSIALRDVDFAFQVTDIVLHAVKTHLGQIDVGMDAYAANGHKPSDFHSSLNI